MQCRRRLRKSSRLAISFVILLAIFSVEEVAHGVAAGVVSLAVGGGAGVLREQLGNEGFIARAPAPIVEGLRKQHAETLALKQKTEAALAALPPE